MGFISIGHTHTTSTLQVLSCIKQKNFKFKEKKKKTHWLIKLNVKWEICPSLFSFYFFLIESKNEKSQPRIIAIKDRKKNITLFIRTLEAYNSFFKFYS